MPSLPEKSPTSLTSLLDRIEKRSSRLPRRWIAVAGGALVVVVLAFMAVRDERTPEATKPSPDSVVLPNFKDVASLSLDYSRLASARTISTFEGDETWRGEGITPFDTSARYEGQASLMLRSVDRSRAVAVLERRLDLSRTELVEAVFSASDPRSIESLTVRLLGPSSAVLEFPVNLPGTGWTPVRMPRAQFVSRGGAPARTWRSVRAVEIELRARAGVEARVNVDLFRSEGPAGEYAGDWIVRDPQMLGAFRTAGGPALLFRNVTASFGALSAVGDAEDFTLTAEVSPLTGGKAGVFFRGDAEGGRGFAFVLGGLGANTWQLLRNDETGTAVLKEGAIRNVTLRSDESYWLRVAVEGSGIEASISRNGTDFVTVAGVRDAMFPFGEVGLAAFDGAVFMVHQVDYKRT